MCWIRLVQLRVAVEKTIRERYQLRDHQWPLPVRVLLAAVRVLLFINNNRFCKLRRSEAKMIGGNQNPTCPSVGVAAPASIASGGTGSSAFIDDNRFCGLRRSEAKMIDGNRNQICPSVGVAAPASIASGGTGSSTFIDDNQNPTCPSPTIIFRQTV